MKISRRQLIKSSLVITTGLSLSKFVRGEASKFSPVLEDSVRSQNNGEAAGFQSVSKDLDRIPRKGEEFNESFVFPDECTCKTIRRLTSRRKFNTKSTYHIKSSFHGSYLVFATYNDSTSGSALIRANAETGDLKVLDHTEPGDKNYFSNGGDMVPGTPFVAYSAGDKIILYNIFTLEKIEYPLISGKKDTDGHTWSGASGTCDGKYLLLPYNDNSIDWNASPEVRDKCVGSSLFRLEVMTGKMEEVYRDDKSKNNHVIANPVNPDYCLIDRDLPPQFFGKSDNGKTPRVLVLHIPTGTIKEISPNDTCKFAYHSNWNFNGTHVYYHGPSDEKCVIEKAKEQGITDFVSPYGECKPKFSAECNPHFIGVAEMNGKIVWEGHFPMMYYGHTGAHTTKDILFIDNLVTDRYVLAFHWRELNRMGIPKVEMVFAHNSIYIDGMQASHPHCTMSDDGNWMSFNAQRNGRTDVFVAKME
jgi:hypothetical protein